jgi:hypothetical protein
MLIAGVKDLPEKWFSQQVDGVIPKNALKRIFVLSLARSLP